MKSVISVMLASAAAIATAAPKPHFDPQRLSQHVKVVSSDAFEGRAPDSAGETKTVDYLVSQFKAAGLKPGGDMAGGKRGWTQDVPLGRFEIKGPITLSVNDGKNKQTLMQPQLTLHGWWWPFRTLGRTTCACGKVS